MNIDWGSDTLLGDVVDIVGGLLGGLLGTLFWFSGIGRAYGGWK